MSIETGWVERGIVKDVQGISWIGNHWGEHHGLVALLNHSPA
jgi:hypothetical protein